MNIQDFTKQLTYLGLAYNKEYTEEEVKVYYDFLGGYNKIVFKNAIKNLIRKSSFVPRINQLIDECEIEKETFRNDTLKFMNEYGYFESYEEYQNTKRLLEKREGSNELINDMNRYYQMMINPNQNIKFLETSRAEKEQREEEEKQRLIEQIKKLDEGIA